MFQNPLKKLWTKEDGEKGSEAVKDSHKHECCDHAHDEYPQDVLVTCDHVHEESPQDVNVTFNSDKPVSDVQSATTVDQKPDSDPNVITVPLDVMDHRNLYRNGYDLIREKAPTMYVIRTQYPAPTVDNPNRVFVKIAELYAYSSIQACTMIGWKPKKCMVIQEQLRESAKPRDLKNMSIDILVNDEVKGKVVVPEGTKYKYIIREAKTLPDVQQALAQKVIVDHRVIPGKSVQFVLQGYCSLKPNLDATGQDVQVEQQTPAPVDASDPQPVVGEDQAQVAPAAAALE